MNRYLPHQNRRECARRLAQVATGRLQGSEDFIPADTRLAARALYDAYETLLDRANGSHLPEQLSGVPERVDDHAGASGEDLGSGERATG